MEMTRRQAEFWTLIIGICTVVSIAVLLLDFGIKAAILEESTRLRIAIEDEARKNGRQSKETNTGRIDNDDSVDGPIPDDLLVVDSTGMEA